MMAPDIYIISLKEEIARRQRRSEIMDHFGLSYQFFDAVDGRQMDVREQPMYHSSKRLTYFGRHLKGAEWGCLLSHLRVCEDVVQRNLPYALIFEDDVIIDDEFMDVMKAIAHMQKSFDLIRVFGRKKIAQAGSRPAYRLTDTYFLGRLKTAPGGAYAYFISRRGAKKLLDYCRTKKVAYPIDAIMGRCWETGLDAYTIGTLRSEYRPLVTVDLDIKSSIGEDRFDKTLSDIDGFRRFVFPLTRIWFKITENVGKRAFYLKTLLSDSKSYRNSQSQ